MRLALSRRGILGGGAALLGGAAFGGCTPATTTATTTAAAARPIGIQLYTLRSLMEQDFAGTLGHIADIGYDEVEFAGYFNTTPSEVRRILTNVDLRAPSAHVSRDLIRDNPMPSIEAGAEIGHQWLVLNWLAPEERQTLDQYRAWADVCNRFAEQCRTAGMRFAYHNHDFEFVPIDGVVPYDILMERCDPELVKFELDLFWASKVSQDIPALLARAPARFPLCHVKDMDAAGNMADVGAGTIDFSAIFANHTFEHYFVERDDATDPMATAEAGYRGLSDLFPANAG